MLKVNDYKFRFVTVSTKRYMNSMIGCIVRVMKIRVIFNSKSRLNTSSQDEKGKNGFPSR